MHPGSRAHMLGALLTGQSELGSFLGTRVAGAGRGPLVLRSSGVTDDVGRFFGHLRRSLQGRLGRLRQVVLSIIVDDSRCTGGFGVLASVGNVNLVGTITLVICASGFAGFGFGRHGVTAC